MNTGIRLLLYEAVSDARALDLAERDIRAQEARFSRFLPDSELSQLNRAAGRWVTPSAEMLEVLTLARMLHRETGGLFNPGVLPALEWSGYDRSFERLPADRPAPRAPLLTAIGIEALELDGDRVRVPAGCRLDLGGIVKGWTADRVADTLADVGPVLVDLGGDIAVRGRTPEGAWRIAIESPDGRCLLTTLAVDEGGVATSGTVRRRWRTGHTVQHHIIDPRTGAAARSDVLQAVVLTDRAVHADVWAKAAVILGRAGCEQLLTVSEASIEMLLITADGGITATSGMPLDRSHAA